MEAIVTITLASCSLMILIHNTDNTLICLFLASEGQNCRITACYCTSRPSLPIIARGRIILREMYMRVYSTRRDVCAFGIYELGTGTAWKIMAKAGYLACNDADFCASWQDLCRGDLFKDQSSL